MCEYCIFVCVFVLKCQTKDRISAIKINCYLHFEMKFYVYCWKYRITAYSNDIGNKHTQRPDLIVLFTWNHDPSTKLKLYHSLLPQQIPTETKQIRWTQKENKVSCLFTIFSHFLPHITLSIIFTGSLDGVRVRALVPSFHFHVFFYLFLTFLVL